MTRVPVEAAQIQKVSEMTPQNGELTGKAAEEPLFFVRRQSAQYFYSFSPDVDRCDTKGKFMEMDVAEAGFGNHARTSCEGNQGQSRGGTCGALYREISPRQPAQTMEVKIVQLPEQLGTSGWKTQYNQPTSWTQHPPHLSQSRFLSITFLMPKAMVIESRHYWQTAVLSNQAILSAYSDVLPSRPQDQPSSQKSAP
jgi:hypothetical protein